MGSIAPAASTLMRRVLELATANARAGGGPFAAAVVKTANLQHGRQQTLALEANAVLQTSDVTAHAEVAAIRAACAALSSPDLAGHTLLTSCFPCPMCAGAAYWARLGASACRGRGRRRPWSTTEPSRVARAPQTPSSTLRRPL
jgi:guanine deaminase